MATTSAVIEKDDKIITIHFKPSQLPKADDITFKPERGGTDKYDVVTYLKMDFNFKQCLNVCTSTKELRDFLKTGGQMSYTLQNKAKNSILFSILRGVKPSADNYILSLNRFVSICSATVVYNSYGQAFDWTSNTYQAAPNLNKMVISESHINRLAETIGIKKDSHIYWLWLPGFENLFDLYPCETIAMAAWRALNIHKFPKMDKDPIKALKAISNKLKKRNKTVADFPQSEMKTVFEELNKATHVSPSDEHATVVYEQIKDLFLTV
nr:nucleocapsid protein [Pear chlorotic leaf spot-associated virus]